MSKVVKAVLCVIATMLFSVPSIGGGDRSMLLELVENMPSAWKPIEINDESVQIAYWDQLDFLSCAAQHSSQFGDKAVMWMQPSFSKAYYTLAYYSVEDGNLEEANAHIDKALALEPNHPLVLNEKGFILQLMGDHSAAIEKFVAATELQTCEGGRGKARAYRGIGISLIETGELELAEQAFLKSLEIMPDNEIAKRELKYIEGLRAKQHDDQPIFVVPQ